MKNNYAVVLALLLFVIPAAGQSAQVFESQTIQNLRSGQENAYVCTFKVYTGDHLEWIQAVKTYSFEITSAEGQLSDQGDSEVTYNIVKEGKPGTVKIKREGEGLWLTLDLRVGNQMGAYYKFRVSIVK